MPFLRPYRRYLHVNFTENSTESMNVVAVNLFTGSSTGRRDICTSNVGGSSSLLGSSNGSHSSFTVMLTPPPAREIRTNLSALPLRRLDLEAIS